MRHLRADLLPSRKLEAIEGGEGTSTLRQPPAATLVPLPALDLYY